jgi:hypothetical protein
MIRVHAPPDHRVHRLLHSAGGRHAGFERDGDDVLMAKVLNPLRLLRLLAGELGDRARAAALPPGTVLGLRTAERKYRIEFRDDGPRITARSLGPDCLGLESDDFGRMLLGYLDWDSALAAGRIQATSPAALAIAQLLFPRLPWWHPLLDDLPAQK